MSTKLIFVLIFLTTVSPLYVNSEDENQDYTTLMSTKIISTQSPNESPDKSNSQTTTELNTETTTLEEEEEFEPMPPKGIVGQFLMDGPDVRKLSKNSSAEKTFIYFSELVSDELKKEFSKVASDFHEYFFLLQELVSQNCYFSLVRWANRAQKGEPRALKLLDSSAKFLPNGFLEGTFTDLGNFDQCIRNDIPITKGDEDRPLDGRYCLVKIWPPLPKRRPNLKYSDRVLDFRNTDLENGSVDYVLSSANNFYSNAFTVGLCFASDCDRNDINAMINNSLHKYNLGVEVGNDCYTEEVIKLEFSYFFDKLDFTSGLSILLIGAMCSLVGLATAYEIIYNFFHDIKNIKESEKPIYLCFSLLSNIKYLISLKNNFEDKTDLKSIYFWKVLAIIWVVISNVYFLGFQPQIRAFVQNIQSEMKRRGSCLPFQFILNSWYASEIFFFIGGLLMAYTITTHLNRNDGKISLIKYFGKRLIRLTPPIVFAILLIFLMPLYPNGGPIYKSSTEHLRDTCAKNWWKSLLFITNWLDPNTICLPQLWFVSAFLQLNVMAVLVLILTYKRPRAFKIVIITTILIGIIFPMYITYKYDVSAKSPFMNRPLLDEIANDLKLKHFLTFNHLSVFFIGILIGVKLCSDKIKHTPNILTWLGLWSILPLIHVLTEYITFLWNDINSEPSLKLSILFNGFSRIFQISGIAWIVNECVNERAGWIGKVLSNKQFLPLSRLVYQIYLLNLIVVWFYFFTKRDLIIYRDFELLFISCGVFVSTVILSIFGYLVFEAPFIRLSQRVFNSGNTALKREIKSQLSQRHVNLQMESIDINGNPITEKKQESFDQNFNVRL